MTALSRPAYEVLTVMINLPRRRWSARVIKKLRRITAAAQERPRQQKPPTNARGDGGAPTTTTSPPRGGGFPGLTLPSPLIREKAKTTIASSSNQATKNYRQAGR